jgi:hypothetical protein
MTKSRMRIGLSTIRAVLLLVENNSFVIYYGENAHTGVV